MVGHAIGNDADEAQRAQVLDYRRMGQSRDRRQRTREPRYTGVAYGNQHNAAIIDVGVTRDYTRRV